ncbi:MAG: hypothetical protein N2Z72_04430 [Bacteroidales bacterium]|nr:hypothetical protein [Bacteroidales bacterium]
MKTIKLIYLFITIIGIHNFVSAQCQLDQSQTYSNGGRSARNIPGAYEGQSFTVGISGKLCKIEMLMFSTVPGPMSGSGTLKIYSGNGVSGPLLASQTVYVYVPSGDVWQSWTISSPPTVVAGSIYTFQFIPTQGGGLPDPYGVRVSLTNVHPGGVDLNNPTGDLAFKVHVQSCSLNANIYTNSPTSFCQGGSAILYSSQQGSPFTYQWLLNNNPINGATNSTYTATQTGNYSLILDSLGCKDTSNIISITVYPLPSVSINPIPSYINYFASPLTLTGNPNGGTFSGSGITGNIFNPSAAGLGKHTIFYNYTNNYGCSNSANVTTIVYDTLGVVCTSYDTILISVTDTLIVDVVLTGLLPQIILTQFVFIQIRFNPLYR